MDASDRQRKPNDRKLGDEWLDWDGHEAPRSTETGARLFLVLAVLTTACLIAAVGLSLWLISPRLSQLSTILPRLFSVMFFAFAGVLVLWVVLFAWSAARRRPVARWLAIPRLVNRLLSLVIGLGRVFGVSADRLTNSFLKVHNLFVAAVPRLIPPERLLVLAPRCLTKENNVRLRNLRDHYGFNMAVVGGGTAARTKIRELRPHLVIAIACERDLISGFREVNPMIPVIGIPNRRPEGPCKNTCIDLSFIEDTILRCLGVRTPSTS